MSNNQGHFTNTAINISDLTTLVANLATFIADLTTSVADLTTFIAEPATLAVILAGNVSESA